jgi:hypothetical protein
VEKGKNSFVLYHDLIHVVEKLIQKDRADGTNNAGELFYQIVQYVNGVYEEPANFIVEMAFEPIKQQLNRDFDKWETERLKRIEAGRKGGEKSGEVRRAKANEASASNDEANEASASNGTNEADANKADTTRKASTGLSYIDEDDLPF